MQDQIDSLNESTKKLIALIPDDIYIDNFRDIIDLIKSKLDQIKTKKLVIDIRNNDREKLIFIELDSNLYKAHSDLQAIENQHNNTTIHDILVNDIAETFKDIKNEMLAKVDDYIKRTMMISTELTKCIIEIERIKETCTRTNQTINNLDSTVKKINEFISGLNTYKIQKI